MIKSRCLSPIINFVIYPKGIFFNNYQKWQYMIEEHPVKFMQEDVYKYLEDSRDALGKYINCDKNDLIYVPNPTHAVANVINNVNLNKGDEVLTTDLEYGSCDRMWFYESKKRNFSYIRSKVSFPVIDNESFCKEFWSTASERTKFYRYQKLFLKLKEEESRQLLMVHMFQLILI